MEPKELGKITKEDRIFSLYLKIFTSFCHIFHKHKLPVKVTSIFGKSSASCSFYLCLKIHFKRSNPKKIRNLKYLLFFGTLSNFVKSNF